MSELTSQIVLDYPVRARARYGWGRPDHQLLTLTLDSRRPRYKSLLLDIMRYADELARVAVDSPAHESEPQWINGYLPGLDAVLLYGQVARLRPKQYLEIGSGSSTKFVRRCIRNQRLATRITSIDPHPRAEIDRLCDAVIRQPVEDLDPSVVDMLGPGDVLFIDGSHRVFMNSDVVVCFLELLPRLPPDVHVHVHDVWIPSDYPPGWADRFYSEQYLIAAQLLAGATKYEVELPAWYIVNDPELSFMLLPLWERPHLTRVERHGCSIWLRTT
jgi:hypothetical protein